MNSLADLESHINLFHANIIRKQVKTEPTSQASKFPAPDLGAPVPLIYNEPPLLPPINFQRDLLFKEVCKILTPFLGQDSSGHLDMEIDELKS